MDDVERIVIANRTMAAVLAVIPAALVVLVARFLTLGNPPVGLRLAAAAAVAVAAWIGYRLLTARVVVTDTGVEVRGVFHEGQVLWTDLETAETAPAHRAIRALVWGVMQPHGLVLRGRTRTLRPIATVCQADDEELQRALGAIRVRLGAWGVPTPRESQESMTAA